jgi:hypothetical protein
MVRLVLIVAAPSKSLTLWSYRNLDDIPKKTSNTEGKLVLGRINKGKSSENLDFGKTPQFLLSSAAVLNSF